MSTEPTIDPPELWRIGSIGDVRAPTTVVQRSGRLVALHTLLGSPAPTVLEILQDWTQWESRLDALDLDSAEKDLDADEVSWLPPVVYPRKLIICGANYRAHLAEMGVDPDVFTRPYTVLKPASTSLIGHRDAIVIPEQLEWPDWEGELGVVIGRRTRRCRPADALSAVAGYLPVNDVSARDWMGSSLPVVGQDWVLGKGFDTFTPAGPLITPARFVPDPQSLRLTLSVNGTLKQDTMTSDMLFSVAELITHLSSILTLEPGDMLLTGSPSGVGFGRDPRERLEPGDVVRVEVSGLGTLESDVTREFSRPQRHCRTPRSSS